MKKLIAILLVTLLLLSTASAVAAEKITIGVTAMPHAVIIEHIKPAFEALGYELEIVVASDYYLFNPATAAGDTDCNYFQHTPFMDADNAKMKEEDQLIAAFMVHYEPLGLYPGQKKAIADIADGDVIAVPNDSSNYMRALLLLQEAGLIVLPEDASAATNYTKEDIKEYKVQIEISELNAELLPSAIEDVAFAVINGNYAMDAGFTSAADAVQREPVDGSVAATYGNIVAIRNADADAQWVKDLQSVLLTDEVREFILTAPEFGGAVVPVF